MSRKATLSPAHDEIVIVSPEPARGQGGVTSGYAVAVRLRRGLVQSQKGAAIVCDMRLSVT